MTDKTGPRPPTLTVSYGPPPHRLISRWEDGGATHLLLEDIGGGVFPLVLTLAIIQAVQDRPGKVYLNPSVAGYRVRTAAPALWDPPSAGLWVQGMEIDATLDGDQFDAMTRMEEAANYDAVDAGGLQVYEWSGGDHE